MTTYRADYSFTCEHHAVVELRDSETDKIIKDDIPPFKLAVKHLVVEHTAADCQTAQHRLVNDTLDFLSAIATDKSRNWRFSKLKYFLRERYEYK